MPIILVYKVLSFPNEILSAPQMRFTTSLHHDVNRWNWLTSDGMQRMSFQRLETDICSVLNTIFDAHTICIGNRNDMVGVVNIIIAISNTNITNPVHVNPGFINLEHYLGQNIGLILPNIRLLIKVGYTSHHIPMISSFVPSGNLT